jgi:catalase
MASALVFELSKVETPHVRDAVVGHLRHIDADLAQRVADGLGLRALPAAPALAEAVQDLPLSPALRIIDRMQPTLQGRCVGILVADGTNGAAVAKLRRAVEKAGGTVKVVAPKVGGVVLKDGTLLAADGQLQGTPSVLFDAVASILAPAMGEQLAKEAAAVDWFRDAFGHLKAIAACKGTHAILKAGGIEPDAGVVDPADVQAFVQAAKTRQWDREPQVRTLA